MEGGALREEIYFDLLQNNSYRRCRSLLVDKRCLDGRTVALVAEWAVIVFWMRSTCCLCRIQELLQDAPSVVLM